MRSEKQNSTNFSFSGKQESKSNLIIIFFKASKQNKCVIPKKQGMVGRGLMDHHVLLHPQKPERDSRLERSPY